MSWEWRPETPEEVAEHQRMRNNLMQCQERSDDKKVYQKAPGRRRERPRSVLLIIVILIYIIYFAFRGTSPEAKNYVSNLGGLVNVGDYKFSDSVSMDVAEYIEQVNIVNQAWTNVDSGFYVKTIGSSAVVRNDDDSGIKILMDELEELKALSIWSKDFQSYHVVCKQYYGAIYVFFSEFSTKNQIALKKYNKHIEDLKKMDNPHNCLINTLKENKYFYYVDEKNTVHFKYNDSLY